MMDAQGASDRERLGAAAGVAALHAALAWAFIAGLGVRIVAAPGSELKLFDVLVPPPPAEERPPPADRSPRAEGAAAPPDRRARPLPVVAPKAPRPTPLPAADEAAPPGRDPSAGAAELPGPGSGAGGEGSGTGSGGQGSGTGGGGAARAQRIGGALSGATDYPASARRAGLEGSVRVRFVVGVDGRVGGCRIVRSSGHAILDTTTCRLIEERFRYRPARDADGRPVPEVVSRTFDWLLPDAS